jgi:hypothetical protein
MNLKHIEKWWAKGGPYHTTFVEFDLFSFNVFSLKSLM